jgi:hypothetical protein
VIRFNAKARPLIALVGNANSNKAAIADYLKKRHGFARLGLADPLRQALHVLYGFSYLDALTLDRDAPHARLGGRSYRELMQALGDHVRATMGPMFLMQRLVECAVARGDWKNAALVVTDVRLPHELAWARAQGATIVWVYRPGAHLAAPHVTENVPAMRMELGQPDDASLTDEGTLEQLFEQVDAVLERLGEAVTP